MINFHIYITFHPIIRYATHGTDMLLLFPMFPFDPMPEKDVEVSRKFIKMLVDFAENGKITSYPDWKQLDLESQTYLEINDEFSVKNGLPYQDRMTFWRSLNVYWNHTLNRSDQLKKDEL